MRKFLRKVGKGLEPETIKERIFKELEKNPMLLPKQLCKLTNLDYKYYHNYVTKLRSKWKTLPRDKQGLKPLSFHNWHGYVFVPKKVDRVLAVGCGWIQTKSRNHYLMWKDGKLGRLEWHVNGRIKVWIRKPANFGKAMQLLANAFFSSGLIYDIRIFEVFAKSLRFKGASAIFESKQRLPYMKIDFLKLSNGVVIKVGDRSHPNAVEVDFCFPDWGEKSERLLQRFLDVLEPKKKERGEPGDVTYRV